MYSFSLDGGEKILKKGEANMEKGGETYHGALYLTDCRMVFVGYLMELDEKYMEEVSLVHIRSIEPERTLFIVPNRLKIATIRDETVSFIVKGRNSWLTAVQAQLKQIG